jgi:hypothetical protein
MTNLAAYAVYILCFLTSGVCAALLLRAWARARSRLLFWTAVSFIFLALNNLGLVIDLVILPGEGLRIARHAPAVFAVAVLLYGFIWEIER